MGGSADVVIGAFDHTIQMLAKQQPVVALVQLGRYPGYVLGVAGPKMQTYKGPRDLKGMKIGITAPGSGKPMSALGQKRTFNREFKYGVAGAVAHTAWRSMRPTHRER